MCAAALPTMLVQAETPMFTEILNTTGNLFVTWQVALAPWVPG